MFLPALLCIATFHQEPMPVSLNGIWKTDAGEVFTIAAPSTIWGEFNGRHYSAYSLNSVDNGGFYGLFESGDKLTLSGSSSKSGAAEMIHNGTPPPGGASLYTNYQIPNVPEPTVPGDSGELRMTAYPSGMIKMVWISKQGITVFDDIISFVGKSDRVSIYGTYSDKDTRIQITESEGRSLRTFDGVVIIGGIRYSLHGFRAWGRGSFNLVNRETAAEAGKGWIEWEPTTEFVRKMKKGADPEPTDRIRIWIKPAAGVYVNGTTKILKRE